MEKEHEGVNMNYLFIGGSLDGEMVSIKYPRDVYYRNPDRENVERYKLMAIFDYDIYVLQGISMYGAIGRLIVGYFTRGKV